MTYGHKNAKHFGLITDNTDIFTKHILCFNIKVASALLDVLTRRSGMECYSLKGHGETKDYMQIVKKMDDGFVVKIVRDMDGYEDVTTDFISLELFESCLRTGYISKMETVQKLAANA